MILKIQTQIDEVRQGVGAPRADAMLPAANASARPGGQKAVSGAGAASPENLDSIRFDHEGTLLAVTTILS